MHPTDTKLGKNMAMVDRYAETKFEVKGVKNLRNMGFSNIPVFIWSFLIIREYGSTLYVGMRGTQKTDQYKYTHFILHSFWAEAVSTAVYLKNRSALKEMTPFEAWTKEKPRVVHSSFGMLTYQKMKGESLSLSQRSAFLWAMESQSKVIDFMIRFEQK